MKSIKLFNEEIIKTKVFSVQQDWEIPIPGFFILASKRNIKSIAELNDQESLEFIKLLKKIRLGMKEALNITEVYLFQNEDSEHNFHLWLFPRYKWMDKFGRKIESVRPIINYAKKNMLNDNVFREVKASVKKMKEYMSNFKNKDNAT